MFGQLRRNGLDLLHLVESQRIWNFQMDVEQEQLSMLIQDQLKSLVNGTTWLQIFL